MQTREHDLVVLAVGLLPNTAPFALYKGGELERDAFNYVREVNPVMEPGATNVAGLYLAGTVNGAKRYSRYRFTLRRGSNASICIS